MLVKMSAAAVCGTSSRVSARPLELKGHHQLRSSWLLGHGPCSLRELSVGFGRLRGAAAGRAAPRKRRPSFSERKHG
jgi:hypothetical protein